MLFRHSRNRGLLSPSIVLCINARFLDNKKNIFESRRVYFSCVMMFPRFFQLVTGVEGDFCPCGYSITMRLSQQADTSRVYILDGSTSYCAILL